MKEIVYLTFGETKELFDVINKDNSKNGCRNRAIFHLAKYCALRISELAQIKIEDYVESQSGIYCNRVNRSNSNFIYIYENSTKKALNEYYRLRKTMNVDSDYLFISQKQSPISTQVLDYIMKEYCQMTSIPEEKWHFHVLRHTRAIELLKMGLNVNELQWYLGHKDIRNTVEYLKDIEINEKEIFEKIKKGVEQIE